VKEIPPIENDPISSPVKDDAAPTELNAQPVQSQSWTVNPVGSLLFTGSPDAYAYLFKVAGLLLWALPLNGSTVKNLPYPVE
jgi:hypothetical protein